MTMLKGNLKSNGSYIGFLFFLISLFITSVSFAANVTLSWDPPTTNSDGTPLTDFAGYKVYSGISSGNYTQSTDTGNVTSYTTTNLSGGPTYYFAVTAYDSSGNESGFSNEISVAISATSYYCDKDNDGYINSSTDGSCTGTGCQPAGCQTTAGNDCNDNNTNIKPGAPDTICNGTDDNCNGQIDEGYVATTTTCGVGACSATGQLTCQNGTVVNTCTPGTPAASDNTCNGIDNNCNGQIDEGYVATTTTCGVGACSATGQLTCQNGTVVNTCTPGTPPANDTTCNGIHVTLSWDPPTTNSDGTPLTDFAGYKVYSGISSGNYTQSTDTGNVTSYTTTNLSGGPTYYFAVTAYDSSGNESGFSNEISVAISATSYYCDKDNDGYINSSTDGSCTGTGCQPAGCQTTAGNDCNDNNTNIKPGAPDTICNGTDDNCNGQIDEGYVATTTTCGVGACSATGQLTCQNGTVVNTCTPGTPAASDNTCNGIDNNCNGQIDEGYVATTTTCGVGACSATGQLTCQNGTVVNTCTPGTPAASDNTCNGIDNNCNGQIDEGYVATTTTCGVGNCASTGVQQCTSGQLVNTCIPYPPTTEVCDGSDNNCNGQIDEICGPAISVSKVLLSEDFSGGIPGTWGKTGRWNTDNPCSKNITTPFVPPFAIVDSSCTTAGIDELVSPPLDATGCSDLQLAFSNQYHQTNGNVEVDISDDGGASWMNSLLMVTDDGYPTPNWKNIDISSIAGTQNAKIKFKYSNNSTGGFWALDNIWGTCQPTQITFSGQAQMPSAAQTVIIANTGDNSLMISAISTEGVNASDFIIDSGNDTCSGRTLLPSESCTLDIVFLPASGGTKSANLSIPSNDPAKPIWSIPLTGIAAEVNPVPVIKANGLAGSVTVRRGKRVIVTFELDPGSYVSKNADWWVLMEYGGSWKYYSAKTRRWSTGSSLYKQSPLVKQGPVKVFSSSSMSRGKYTFYFGVDTNMNGIKDPEEYYNDIVTVNVQ
jgi:protein involved in ribonucleotide reduction